VKKRKGTKMIKKEIYPKTKRLKISGEKISITEKLDGSNLCIFKKNDVLYIAQRKTILSIDEIEEHKDLMYKGLYQWLIDNGENIKLNEGSAICGEWLGMGKLKYTIDEFDKRLYMFAKANIDDDFNLYNLIYDHDLFVYSFEEQKIPSFIGVVPVVAELFFIPSKVHLDKIYERYCADVKRNVEGFVIDYSNIISKYVRMKNGKLQEHYDRGE
jgi:hypothetical protein